MLGKLESKYDTDSREKETVQQAEGRNRSHDFQTVSPRGMREGID
jgi:hypothetical protein